MAQGSVMLMGLARSERGADARTGYLRPHTSERARMTEGEELVLVEAALAGRPEAMRRLVSWLMPVIQVRVARALLAGGGGAHRNLAEEVEDMSQEVFTTLFERDARVLRAWRPDGGLSLRNFVGMVARRKVGAILGVRKRNPWYEEPMEGEAVERALPAEADAERQLAASEIVSSALRQTEEGLSERGKQLLTWMIRDGLSHEEIRERTSLSDAAIYQWRSRLSKTLRGHVETLMNEEGQAPRSGAEEAP